MSDLFEVIEDAVTDAALPEDPIADDSQDTPETVEAAPESTDEAPVEVEATEPSEPSPAVPSPVAKPEAKPVDDFDKRFGLTKDSPTGRENRIPYSRVKKITEKAVKDAQSEWEKSTNPRLAEYESKLKEYDARFADVNKFEEILVNDPPQFLAKLATLPQYQSFFAEIDALVQAVQGKTDGKAAPQSAIPSDMPLPDQTLPDGSKAYSLEGLAARDAWNRAQAAKIAREEVIKEVTQTYGPMYEKFQTQERLQAVGRTVTKQIEEANKWPAFKENEPDIVKALQENPQISLEAAYQKVVFPKLIADRNKVREEVLAELKRAPRATSAPSSSSRPGPQAFNGKRDLEAVIREAIQPLKG